MFTRRRSRSRIRRWRLCMRKGGGCCARLRTAVGSSGGSLHSSTTRRRSSRCFSNCSQAHLRRMTYKSTCKKLVIKISVKRSNLFLLHCFWIWIRPRILILNPFLVKILKCYVSEPVLAMSNQRSFKIESFRFGAFVPKKIEYIRFWNKILDRNKTFSISTRKFWSKSFCSGSFSNFFWDN